MSQVTLSAPQPTALERKPSVWRRLLLRRGRPVPHETPAQRQQRVLDALEGARRQLTDGWIQGAWFAVPTPSGRPRALRDVEIGSVALGGPVSGSCLVGAAFRGVRADGGSDAEVGPVIDALYDALWEQRGGTAPLTTRAASPAVRQARVRTLTAWNDAPGRSREEIVAVVDRAISRTILGLVGAEGSATPQRAAVRA